MIYPGRATLPRHLLRTVERPGRYLGGEVNSVRKRSGASSICLLFPDLYDIGISYYGFQILYHLLNREEEVVCERTYLPWFDMQRLMSEERIPLFSLESRRPVREFDVLGITLQTEFHYPGVIKALDLAGIPRRAADRTSSDPLVICGGPCAYHPEPVAPFFDAFLLGDGEDSAVELMSFLQSIPFRRMKRQEVWERLAELSGVYVPGLYRQEDGGRITPLDNAKRVIRGRTVSSLRSDFYPNRPLVPLVKGTHDRLVVEIMRGCTQGCRFCQAGMVHRPVRERTPEEIAAQVEEGLDTTGFDEVGLLSLSTSDYRGIDQLISILTERLAGRHATVAFPSLRPSSFSEDIARARIGGRRTTITFALEAGSARLRRVINKRLDEAELMTAVERAYRFGWKTVKLYLMTGLPTETEDDLQDTARFLTTLQREVPRGRKLNVAVSPFIPKPHTPFERAQFLLPEEQEKRRAILSRALNSPRSALEWQGTDEALIEAVLSRGDRRLATAIERVADNGSGLESWGRCFSLNRWLNAFDEALPDWSSSLGESSWDKETPWDHLSKGVSRSFRRKEWESALKGEMIHDCREGECPQCGLAALCGTADDSHRLTVPPDETDESRRLTVPVDIETEPTSETQIPHDPLPRFRLEFTKLGRARMLGHHDLMRTVILAMRRAGAPLAYNHGFQPRAIVSFGPALPLGRGAAKLWVEFTAFETFDSAALFERLKMEMPIGLKALAILPLTEVSHRMDGYRFRMTGRIPEGAANEVAGVIANGAKNAQWRLEGAGYAIHLDWDRSDGSPLGDRRIEEGLMGLGGEASKLRIAVSTWL